MKTLTIEHLSPYLPYGLNAIANIDYSEYDVLISGYLYYNERPHFECRNKLDPKIRGYYLVEEVKPYLRPLSDLTKEIEHNGEKFVPIEYNAFKESKEHLIEYQNGFMHYKSVKYGIMQRLLEWHFDVFGLIESDLAIDINTLNESK